MDNTINFLIIGAMKSGTTSLFKYLSEHPQVYMPPGKEADFFSNNKNFSNGFSWYRKKYFNSASQMVLWGEASPQYMCFDFVPERIYSILPNVKLIAILRNPINRAYSHYRMAVRRGVEKGSFEECVETLIKRGGATDDKVDLERNFIQFGEYGRIFLNYLKYFSKSNVKIIFMEDLAEKPIKTMQSIFKFLNIKDNFNYEIINKKYHRSGEKKFPNLEKIIMRSKRYFKVFLPFKLRRKLMLWFETEFNVRPVKEPQVKKETRLLLADYYKDDIVLFEKLFGIKSPWNILDSL